MSDTRSKALHDHYDRLESGLLVRPNPDYVSLVAPNGNSREPVHRWFHLKEAFSTRLPMRVLKDIGMESVSGLRMLDPFAGVGTTALSLCDAVAGGDIKEPVVYSVENNPFLHLVASTKLKAIQQPPRGFIRLARKIAALALRGSGEAPPLPELSTFHRLEFFSRPDLNCLLGLRGAIDAEEKAGSDPLHIALARVCLGASIESVGNLRRDGRALRLVDKQQKPTPVQAFLDGADAVEEDLPVRPIRLRGRVHLDDGRLLSTIDNRFDPFDIALFSPPYPNNIDYTEVYKLENWLLGLISDADAFRQQRLATVYSHPSILRGDPLPSGDLGDDENRFVAGVVDPIVEMVPEDRYATGRIRMIRGYARDMYLTLRSLRDRIRARGWVVYVVGNSVHGTGPSQFVIAADLLIAELATGLGFEVASFDVARSLRRRSVYSEFLRESVVFLRRGV